jgi:hypothetical protein
LGNHLWRIAATLGLAAKLDLPARFGRWAYQPYFSVGPEHFGLPDGYDTTNDVLAESLPEHIAPRHRTWLQDPHLWLHIEDTIRLRFAPSPLAREQLRQRYPGLLSLPDKIAVHVRRGDYLTSAERHPVCSEAYYRAALAELPDGNVVVFSDDPAWCREHLSWMRPQAVLGHPVTFPLPESPLDSNPDHLDLFLMAHCRHHVIANSSFSWWGAFLSGNPAPVHPRRWFGPAFSDIDASLMFLPGWIGVDA